MNSQLRPLVVIVVALGALAYLGGIAWAGIATLRSGHSELAIVPGYVTSLVTTIGAALATHFGALFGISQFTPGPGGPRARRGGTRDSAPSFFQVAQWARLPGEPGESSDTGQGRLPVRPSSPDAGGDIDTDPPNGAPPPRRLDGLQVAAAYLYLGSLVLALGFWVASGFSEEASEVIRNMSYSLIGVLAGVLAVALNVRRP